MNEATDFLERLIRLLEESEVRFMISGSFASSFHGEPRATRDIDMVIDCSEAQLRALLSAAQRLDWYVNEEAAVSALRERTMFNVVEPSTGWKADFIVRKTRPYSEREFERRVSASGPVTGTAGASGPSAGTVGVSETLERLLADAEKRQSPDE